MPGRTSRQSTLGQLHFAFVTDGSLDQLLAIACLLEILIKPNQLSSKPSAVWILGPNLEIIEYLNRLLSGDLELRYLCVTQRNDDRYFIQLGLTQLFDLIDTRDTLVALDYDHVVFTPVTMPFHRLRSGVIVSSEVGSEFGIINKRSSLLHTLSETHPNISLLWGRASDLSRIGAEWHQSYEDLVPVVAPRHRIEIAFGVAAQRARVLPKPCKISIQANFANPSLRTSLFHYGGQSNYALSLKRTLKGYAKQLMNSDNAKALLTVVNANLARSVTDYVQTVTTHARHSNSST